MNPNSPTASDVISALRNGPYPSPAYAMIEQLRNRTGASYGSRERYADALVVSCWPSRGIWFGGIEVKVSRSDWKRELEDPEKSEPIQQYCDYWWVAAPVGVIEASEVPQSWGLLEVERKNGHRVLTMKEAPKLQRAELTPEFVASILRNAADAQTSIRAVARAEGYREAAALSDPGRVEMLASDLRAATEAAAKQARKVSNLLREIHPEALAERFARVAEAVKALPEVKP